MNGIVDGLGYGKLASSKLTNSRRTNNAYLLNVLSYSVSCGAGRSAY